MGYVYGYDADEEEGPVVGKDTFGEPIRKYDRNVVVGKDSVGEPITAHDLKPKQVPWDAHLSGGRSRGLENF